MKPRTKKQRLVVELSSKLPAITNKQINWAKDNLFINYAYRTKKQTTCFECGHQWTDADLICPNCGKKLNIREKKRERVFANWEYLAIFTTSGDFQVNRYFYVHKYCKVGEVADYLIKEVAQQWIDDRGNFLIMGRTSINMFSNYNWDFLSNLEIRCNYNKYNLYPTKVFPQKRLIPCLKRNGFTGKLYDQSPLLLMRALLINPYVETLLKANQISLLQHCVSKPSSSIDYWSSMKICIRNNYIVKDADLWIDYLGLLSYFKKDIRNPKVICNDNFKIEHDKLVSKRKKIIAEDWRIRNIEWQEQNQAMYEKKRLEIIKRIEKEDEQYKQSKAKFFDLVFSDDLIDVVVLRSIEEFKQEGDELEHCVFVNEYFKQEGSLILSARKNGQRIETIEVSLNELKILQCRGYLNDPTEFHERIINLVRNNMHKIEERLHLVA